MEYNAGPFPTCELTPDYEARKNPLLNAEIWASLVCEPLIPHMTEAARLDLTVQRESWYGESGGPGYEMGVRTPRGELEETYMWCADDVTKGSSAEEFLCFAAVGRKDRLIIASTGYTDEFMDDLAQRHLAPVHFLLINDIPYFTLVER